MDSNIKEGIVIKTIDYKETSKILYLVTKEGLVSLEVRGANKINSHTHAYSNVITKIAYTSKGHFLSGGKTVNNYTNIKTNYDKLSYTLAIFELTYTLIEHFTDFEIFYNFLNDILELINESEYYKLYFDVFYLKTTYLLGIAPEFKKCTMCGSKTNIAGFVLKNGGMKCVNCLDKYDNIYDNDLIFEIIKLYYLKLDEIKKMEDELKEYKLDLIKKFIDEYYYQFLGYVSKSDNIFKKINGNK